MCRELSACSWTVHCSSPLSWPNHSPIVSMEGLWKNAFGTAPHYHPPHHRITASPPPPPPPPQEHAPAPPTTPHTCTHAHVNTHQARKRHININFLVRLRLGRPPVCLRDQPRFSPRFTQWSPWDKPGLSLGQTGGEWQQKKAFKIYVPYFQDTFDHDKGQKSAIRGAVSAGFFFEFWVYFLFLQVFCAVY